jgi:chromosome segregation ATPase
VQAAQLATLPLIHPWQGCLQQACWKGGRRAKSREIRREQIRQRIDAIHARIKELQAKRQDDADLATVRERLTSAQRQMAASRAAARTAITNSLRAFRKAAEAHERAALQHERVAAASHRAAAAAATQRAERARSLLSDEERNDMRGSDAD